MGYPVIFQTKIAKLPDGRLIHFDRSGCNNDEEGRVKGEFSATIYTEEDFIKRAEGFMDGSKPYKESQRFDLKICSRYASYYDYGKHLLRMLKRAENIDKIIADNYFHAKYCEQVEIFEPERKVVTIEEFRQIPYGTPMRYRPMYKFTSDIDSIINLLEVGKQIIVTIL